MSERTIEERLLHWESEARGSHADTIAAVMREAANELANRKATLDELHEYVAQMCERFGDNRDEIPCDAWRLRDHIMAAEADIAALESAREQDRATLARARETEAALENAIDSSTEGGWMARALDAERELGVAKATLARVEAACEALIAKLDEIPPRAIQLDAYYDNITSAGLKLRAALAPQGERED